MTDEFVSFGSAPEAGQPASEPSQAEGAQPEQPQYLTVEAFRAELDKLSSTIVEEARRAAQSQTGRQLSGLEKKLAKWQEQMQASGVQVSTQMMEQARNRLALQALEQVGEDDSQPTQPAASQANPVVAFVYKQAHAICDQHGVKLEKGDPEYRMLALDDPDPEVFLESVKAAAVAKKARVGDKPPGARAPMATSGQAQGGPLYDQYLREITKVQPGSEAALQIRRKYRGKGLQV